MIESQERSTVSPRARVWHVVAAAAVGVACAGFFVGLSRPPERLVDIHEEEELSSGPRMPAYGELTGARRGPNAELYATGVSRLSVPVDLQEQYERSETERMEALDARSQRRAYDGAPPTIPHAIDQRGFPDCLACHGPLFRLEGRSLQP